MNKISFEYLGPDMIDWEDKVKTFQNKVNKCHDMLHDGTGLGSEFLGWVDLPSNYDREEFERVKIVAEDIRNKSDVFIIIGIGGSYLGARAAMGMLSHSFYNELPKDKRKGPEIYFLGHNMSTSYLNDLLDTIEGKDICVNVISKSGSTTEPAIAFRIIKEYMEDKYGVEEANRRIIATTDKSSGALKKLADKEGYKTFVIPDDVGGRYSVLTPVGLLPMAVAGIDIDQVMEGAKLSMKDLFLEKIEDNPAYEYAVVRNILYSMDKTIEVMVSYEPSLFYMGEWFKQLFGESEGKDGKGIFPASLNFTTDLHSMGQYIQDGRKNIFETILSIDKSMNDVLIKEDKEDLDGLNYLKGKTLDYANKKAMEGTILAHLEGDVPNLKINIPEISPFYFGYLVYFLMKACGMSGYLLGVNPFDQPGVEAYKTNMFKLLGKPGY